MTTEEHEIHPLFADWYRKVDIEPSPETIQRRWACVLRLLQDETPDHVLSLASNFFNAPSAYRHQASQNFASLCKEVDSTFPMKENAILLRVLTGAALAECVRSGHGLTPLAALVVTAANCQGVGAQPELPDVVSECRDYLATEGALVRQEPLMPQKESYTFRAHDLPDLTVLEIENVQNNWNLVTEAFSQIGSIVDEHLEAIRALSDAVVTLRDDTRKGIMKVAAAIRDPRVPILQEETEILWWLMGEYSDQLECPLSDLTADAACIVLGRELADRTRLHLPAPASNAFLLKALSVTKGESGARITLRDVVNSVSREWRVRQADELGSVLTRVGPLAPLASALFRSQEGEDGSDWTPAYKSTTGVDPAVTSLPAGAWAMQSLTECMLFSVLEAEAEE